MTDLLHNERDGSISLLWWSGFEQKETTVTSWLPCCQVPARCPQHLVGPLAAPLSRLYPPPPPPSPPSPPQSTLSIIENRPFNKHHTRNRYHCHYHPHYDVGTCRPTEALALVCEYFTILFTLICILIIILCIFNSPMHNLIQGVALFIISKKYVQINIPLF